MQVVRCHPILHLEPILSHFHFPYYNCEMSHIIFSANLEVIFVLVTQRYIIFSPIEFTFLLLHKLFTTHTACNQIKSIGFISRLLYICCYIAQLEKGQHSVWHIDLFPRPFLYFCRYRINANSMQNSNVQFSTLFSVSNKVMGRHDKWKYF